MFLLIDLKFSTNTIGLLWATQNSALFVVYIVLGHTTAQRGASGGLDLLGTSMGITFIVIMPIGFSEALSAFGSWELVLAGAGVGVCSSVIPYVYDQLAMSRLPRACRWRG